MEIKNPSGTTIYTTYGNVQDTTATFTFKVPSDISGGEYQIKVSNTQTFPTVVKLIRIRDYPRDVLNIVADLPFESYRPGDQVTGKIKASTIDGEPFESAPTFSYSIDFEV
jgi:uncharacterized protein YfaS (alpha-2-macroglobulin family)